MARAKTKTKGKSTRIRSAAKTKKASFWSKRHVKPAIAVALVVAIAGIASILWTRAATVSPLDGTGVPDTNYKIPANAIYMSPKGNDKNNGGKNSPVKTIGRAIAVAPSGGTVVMRGGVYRDGSNSSINKKLTWQAYPHEQVWMDGTNVVTGWKSAGGGVWYVDNWNTPSFCNGQYYSYAYNAQRTDNSGPCNHVDMTKDSRNPMAGSPQMVFVNGKYIHEVANRNQAKGNFYYDKAAKRMYLGVDPGGKTVELAARPTAFRFTAGAAGTVVRGIGFRKYASNEFSGNATHAAVLAHNATGAVFENTVFTQNAGNGLFFAASKSGTVRSSYFIKNGFNGFDANGVHVGKGVDNLVIDSSTFKGNNTEYFGAGCSLSCASGGVKLAHMATFTVKNSVFEGNIGKGFWCDLYCDNATIVNNVMRNNTDTGLYYEVSRGGIIASNLIHDNGGYGLKNGSGQVKIYNNTMVNNKVNALIYDDSRKPSGSEIAPDTTKMEMVNNVLSSGGTFQVWKGQTGANQFFSSLDYNSYYRPNRTPANLVEWRATTGTKVYTSLSAFRGATGLEAHGQDITSGGDPFFVNASSKDFRIRAGGSASKTGKPLPADVARVMGQPAGARIDRGALNWPGRP